MSFSVPPWQAFTTNFLLAPGVRLGLLHAIFALLTITDLTRFFVRCWLDQLHLDHPSITLTADQMLTADADAMLPPPRLLPGHRALAVLEVVGAEEVVAVVTVLNLYTLFKPHKNCDAKRTKSTFHVLIHIPLRLLPCAHPRFLTIYAPTCIDGVCGIQHGLHRSQTTMGPSPF